MSTATKNRVVVTGLGIVSPLGIGKDGFWESIRSGVCGIAPITRFDTRVYKASLAAEVRGFEPTDFMDKKDARRADLYCRYAIAAARLAITDGGVNLDDFDKTRVGAIIGSGVGGLETLETEHTKLLEKGPGRVSPFFIPMMIANMAAGTVCHILGIRGVSYAPVSACASANHSIGEAFEIIRRGDMDALLCGGAEAVITPMALAGFGNMTALYEGGDPTAASLPFDRRRSGFVMGEGAGILFLESLASAEKRGAEIYCELTGYGASSDAFHMTSPDPEGRGAALAMERALSSAGCETSRIGYINAHGTGTPVGDAAESKAVHLVFGDNPPPTGSTKSMTAHLLGAAGGVESAVCALALKHGLLPPTIHYQEPDPACDIDCIPGVARKAEITAALSNSFGFGGHNAVLCFEKLV